MSFRVCQVSCRLSTPRLSLAAGCFVSQMFLLVNLIGVLSDVWLKAISKLISYLVGKPFCSLDEHVPCLACLMGFLDRAGITELLFSLWGGVIFQRWADERRFWKEIAGKKGRQRRREQRSHVWHWTSKNIFLWIKQGISAWSDFAVPRKMMGLLGLQRWFV